MLHTTRCPKIAVASKNLRLRLDQQYLNKKRYILFGIVQHNFLCKYVMYASLTRLQLLPFNPEDRL